MPEMAKLLMTNAYLLSHYFFLQKKGLKDTEENFHFSNGETSGRVPQIFFMFRKPQKYMQITPHYHEFRK